MQRARVWSGLLVVVFLGAVGMALGGCNTSEGFGQDVENTGEAIQEEAQEAK